MRELQGAEKAVIYFAGSIRGGRGDRERYAEIIRMLRAYGTVLTEHIGDESLGDTGEDLTDVEIHDRDLDWLRAATCVVAEVTTPSLGVGYEIGRAVELGIPILCLFRQENERRLSAMIGGSNAVTLGEYRESAELPRILDQFFLA